MPPVPGQLDLLRDWTPPAVTDRFDDVRVRAASLSSRICLAISAALKDSGDSRAQVAKAMSDFLGEAVTKNMLDAYASPAREDHTITLARFVALLAATKDRRLLELVAEGMGWAVIERRHLPLIELAAVTERQADLARHADALRRKARQGGGL